MSGLRDAVKQQTIWLLVLTILGLTLYLNIKRIKANYTELHRKVAENTGMIKFLKGE